MSSIRFEGVCKTYPNGKAVIENLNLDIEDGSFTVLVGPSGCGKTTALRMIAGLEEVTAGKLYHDGQDVTRTEPGDRDVAMVFQNYAIYPHMSVRRNVAFGLKNQGLPKQEIERRVEQVIRQVGLEDYIDAKPSMLSGGQRQRIALARAISKKPGVFLMDEPLSNLDAKLRNQMRSELISLYRNLKSTFVFVTHDQVEAMSMGTRIVIFNQGKVMQNGTPKEIYSDPDNVFVATFIGDPGMNIIALPDSCFIGFRPQKGRFSKPERFQGMTCAGEVVTREMLGLDNLYHVKTKWGNLVVQSAENLDYGDMVTVFVADDDLYYFDHDEQRIRDAQQTMFLRMSTSSMEGLYVTAQHVCKTTAL